MLGNSKKTLNHPYSRTPIPYPLNTPNDIVAKKKSIKRFLIHYLVEWPPLAVLYVLLRVLPLSFFSQLATGVGTLLHIVSSGQRQRIRKNLDFAYGETLNRQQKDRICKEVPINMLKSFIEVAYTVHKKNQATVTGLIRIKGREHIDRALEKGKGVIAVSGHIGNFSITGLKMAAEGYTFHTVIREISNAYQNRLYEWYQTQLGQSFIPSRSFTQIVKRILPALRNNEIVFLITDENRRHGGVFVDFFDHKASTAPGAAVLSLRTGAPIVPMFMVRHDDQSHTLIIEPELPLPETKDKQEAIIEITQQFTTRIENHIRTYPSQWFWAQKRWQTRSE